jgi:ribosomal protein S27E
MTGRYGPDHLGVAMIVVSLVISLLNGIIHFMPIVYISYLILLLAVFRMLSRNITRRRAENDKFIRYWWPVRTRLSRSWANIKHRKTHRFLKCPGCGNTLRVPKGKGRLQITCPKCGERFFRKT